MNWAVSGTREPAPGSTDESVLSIVIALAPEDRADTADSLQQEQ
jgi:hypothetical protein